MRTAFLAAFAAASVSACASQGTNNLSYQQEFDVLTADCNARGGILVPTGGPTSGDPATDYACSLRDSPRLN